MSRPARAFPSCLVLLCAALPAATALAHHSAAQFDFGQSVEVTGTVRHLAVENPHIDLVLDIAQADGGSKEVQFEGHSRNNVFRRGWRPDMVKEGDTITILIAPTRNGEDGGYIQTFRLEDGREF